MGFNKLIIFNTTKWKLFFVQWLTNLGKITRTSLQLRNEKFFIIRCSKVKINHKNEPQVTKV
jgi:hypothetical protein